MVRTVFALAFALAPALALARPPVTLDEALELAAKGSPDLAIARADADAAAADRTSSLGGVLPRLDLSASLGRAFTGPTGSRTVVLGGTPITLPAASASDREDYSLSLQLSQPVFDWRVFRDVGRAGAAARAAARDLDEATLAVAFDVTRRFYEAVRAERTLAVLEKTVTRSEELVARSDALFAAGRSPKSDTLQARVNLANDRVAVESARIRVAQARSALAQALGLDEPGGVSAVPPATLDGPVPSADELPPLEEAVRAALSRRPAAAAQAARLEAADAATGAARAGWLPTLSANGSYGRQGDDLAGEEGVYGDPSRAYSASARLVLTWNLFDGRRTAAAVSRAKALARRARASLDRTEAQVAKEAGDARAASVAHARSVALAAESLGVAEQGLSLARQRLEAGLASQLEVRDASLKLTQAELSLLQARIDHAVARADLSRALGGAL